MSYFIGVSSLYQTPSSLDFTRRLTPSPLNTFDGPRFGVFQKLPITKSFESCCRSVRSSRPNAPPLVTSAIATPNSVLSEEAFKGLSDFSRSSLESEGEEEEGDYGSDGFTSEVDGNGDEENSIANLGLPQQLVTSLNKRGITHLFPIQVYASTISTEARVDNNFFSFVFSDPLCLIRSNSML